MTAQSFDTTQDQEKFLPKEPLDLPLPEKELAYQNTVKTLLSWTAPSRPFQKRRPEYFGSIFLIAALLAILCFLFSQYLLILVILSFVFLVIALAITPPHMYHYRISSEGVTVEDHSYLWQELYDFYFIPRENMDILHIRVRTFFPPELVISLGDIHKEQIKSVLLPYLPYRESVTKTFTQKAGDWLSRTFPLERKPS